MSHRRLHEAINHAQPNDAAEGYTAGWTVWQLQETTQKFTHRNEPLMGVPELR